MSTTMERAATVARRRVDLSDLPFAGGDPAVRLIGHLERPARRHRPMPAKPPHHPTVRTIRADVQARLDVLRPLAREAAVLERVLHALTPEE